jgi:hypothetical protein
MHTSPEHITDVADLGKACWRFFLLFRDFRQYCFKNIV